MENAFSYALGSEPAMQGGDSRYNRLAQDLLFKDVNPDIELEAKTKKVTDKVSETLTVIANEPSLAFFRIQEHVRKCLPQLVETKHEVQDLQQNIQGSSFDTEYAANAVKEMQSSSLHFGNIQDLLKNAIFMKQQIDYEKSRNGQSPEKGTPTAADVERVILPVQRVLDPGTTSINASAYMDPYLTSEHSSEINTESFPVLKLSRAELHRTDTNITHTVAVEINNQNDQLENNNQYAQINNEHESNAKEKQET